VVERLVASILSTLLKFQKNRADLLLYVWKLSIGLVKQVSERHRNIKHVISALSMAMKEILHILPIVWLIYHIVLLLSNMQCKTSASTVKLHTSYLWDRVNLT